MVLRNVAKTFSLEEQRQEINEIAVDLDAVNTTLTNWNAGNWDTAYSWGDHAQAGYWVEDSVKISNWDAAYGWGDHGSVGYWVEDSVKISNWDAAYGWGDHSLEGYLTSETSHTDVVVDGDFTTTGLMKRGATSGSYSVITDNSANWDTAYGWGDHAAAGYLSVFVETDPTFTSSAAYGIDATDITNWDTAYGWGDHSLEGYAVGTIPTPGGTSSGAGTAGDPFIGSLQYNGGGGDFFGDSLLVWDTTNNRLSVGVALSAVGGAPGGTNGALNVYTNQGSGVWATQIRSDGTGGNGLFLRAGANSSHYTAYFTGNSETDVHFVVRGDGHIGAGISDPEAKFTLYQTPTSTSKKIEYVRHVRSSSIIAFNGTGGGASKTFNVFLPMQSLKGVVVEYNVSINRFDNGNDHYDDFDVWNLKYENTSQRILVQETALRIDNGGASTAVSAKTHTVNAGNGFDAQFQINGEYDGYLLVNMRGVGVVGAPTITIT